MVIRAISAAALVCGVLVSGCGSDDKPSAGKTTTTPSAAQSRAEKVIRGWADALRGGDLKKAATYFAVPVTVSNSGTPLKLLTPAEVEFFNQTLPCGAKVTSTKQISRGFTLATFELTERPGEGNCGTGTGNTARVAIRVKKGKITDWRRVGALPQVPQEKA